MILWIWNQLDLMVIMCDKSGDLLLRIAWPLRQARISWTWVLGILGTYYEAPSRSQTDILLDFAEL